MNERIRKLVEQAALATNEDPNGEYPAHMMQKFAELIVKECGQVLVDNTPVVDLIEDWDKGYDRAMNDSIHHIYEHFGIEYEIL